MFGKYSDNWYCHSCYMQYKDDILGGKPWVKFLQNCEVKRRRTREFQVVYLGNEFDISDSGELISKYGKT